MLPPDISLVTREHLAESQTTGSQPQEGELSLTEGSNMLLSEMFADLLEARGEETNREAAEEG